MNQYILRTSKKEGKAPLSFRFYKKGAYNFFVSTKVDVNIKEWQNCKTDKQQDNYLEKNNLTDILRDVYKAVDSLVNEGVYDKKRIVEAVDAVVFKEERSAEAERTKVEAEAEEARKKNVLLWLTNFHQSISNGTRRKKNGGVYGYNTIRNWGQFVRLFTAFYKRRPFTWDDIDKNLIDRFRKYLEDYGCMKSTASKSMEYFRTMIRFAYDDKVNTNAHSMNCIVGGQVTEEDKAKEIYLTAEELKALYDMPLTGLKEQVRDVFLVGCYTCQRFSDYSTIKKENFGYTASGVRVIRLTQQKTKKKVVIPILNKNLEAIAEKYDYNLPTLNDVVFNRYIKEILQELSDSCATLAEKERTLLTLTERKAEKKGESTFERDDEGRVVKPRYELVSSHTARRTGITLMVLSKRYTLLQMMKISGHSTARIFEEYIKLSGDEFAEEIAKQRKEEDNDDIF